MPDGLVQARELPDGSYEIVDDGPATDRLRKGDATLGWAGDEHLSLVVNTVEHRWEVWELCSDGVNRRAMHCPMKPGAGLPITSLIRAIVRHDTRHVDVVGEAEAADVKRRAVLDARFREQTGEAGDKLAHALAKDLDIPAADGKVFPLRGRR